MGNKIFVTIVLLLWVINIASSQCTPPITAPTITFNPATPCGGYDVFIGASPSFPNLTYEWSFDDGLMDTIYGSSVIYDFPTDPDNDITYNINLTVIDGNGCSEDFTTPITVTAAPTFEVIGNFSACLPSFSNQTTFTTTFEIINGESGASYNWFFGDGNAIFNSTNTIETHTYNDYGTYNLVVQTTNGTCLGTFEQEVTFYIRPTASMNIIGDPDICEGDTLFVQNNTDPTHVIFYVWDWGNGERDTVYGNDDAFFVYEFGDDVICNSPPQSGAQYDITLIAVNDCLEHSNSSPIFVSLTPRAIISQPDTLCASNPSLTFGNESCPSANSGYYDVNEYFWDFGDGTTSVEFTPTHVFPGPGIYTVTMVAENDCGMAEDSVEIVVIEDPLADANVTIVNASGSQNGEFCFPFELDLVNQSSGDSITFEWEITNTFDPNNGGWAFINGTDSVSNNAQVEITDLGYYNVQLTASSLCGDSVWDTLIVAIEPPVIELDSIFDGCDEMTITPTYTLDNGFSNFLTYDWQFPGGIPSSSTDSNPSDIYYAVPGTYTVTATVTNVCGSSTDDVTFTVETTATADAGGDMEFCIDDAPFQLSATPTGGVYSGNGINSSGLFTPVFAGIGIHEIVYANLTLDCPTYDTIDITVHDLPIVDAGLPQSTCENEGTITLTGATPVGGTWSGPGIIDPANGVMDPLISGVGSFNMIYSYTDGNTCTNTDFKVVNIIGLPVINAGDTILFCDIPENLQIVGYSPAGGTWAGTGIVDANQGLFNPVLAGGIGDYDAVYTYTDVNGCTNMDTLVVRVDVLPDPNAGADLEFCIDEPIFDLASTPNGGNWSGAGIINSNTGTYYAQAAGVGVHELIYTVGAGSCAVSDTAEITIYELPTVTAGIDESLCEGSTQFNLGGFSPLGGTWTGAGIMDPFVGSFDPVVAGVGTHTLTYSYTDPITNCFNSDEKLVTITPLPNIVLGDPITMCDANMDVQIEGFAPLGGTWTGLGITDPFVGLFNPQGAGGIGNYQVYYAFTNANGCSNSDTLYIEVVPPPTVEAGLADTLCINDTQFLLSDYSPTGGSWTGTGIIDGTGGVFDPSISGVGVHTLTYTYGDGSCEQSDTKDIYVSPLPVVNAGMDLEFCIDDLPYTITSFIPVNGLWSGTGITDPTGIFDPQSAGVGTYPLTLSYTDPITGCYNEEIISAIVNPLPIVEAGAPAVYCITTDNITLINYSPLGGTWSGTGVVDPSNGIFNADVAGGVGQYNLVYSFTDANSCTNTDTLLVSIIDGDLIVPGPNDTICIDNGLWTLTGFSPLGGTWSGPGVVDPVLATFDPISSGIGLHTLTYTVGTGTCLRTETKTIWVAGLPFVDAAEDEQHCIDILPYQLTNFFPITGGVWAGNGVDPTGFFTPADAGIGIHTLTYSYTDPITNCTNTDDKEITIYGLPNVSVGDTVEYCNNPNDITLTGYTPLGGQWSGTGIVDFTNGIFNTQVAGGVGIYDVVYTFADVNGCVSDDTLTLDIILGDIVEGGPDTALCIDYGFYTLSGFSPLGGLWSGTGILDPNNGLFDPITAGAGIHTLTYTYGSGTCEKIDSRTILVGTIPTVNAGSDELGCSADDPYILLGFAPAGGIWTGTGITDPIGIFDPSLAGVGIHTLTYNYTNPITGCQNSDTKVIDLQAAPFVQAGDNVEICNSATDLTFTSFSPTGGYWTGQGIIDGVNGVFNSVVAGGPGTYTATYGYTSANGCYNEDTLQVIVDPLPIVDPGVDTAFCIDDGLFIMNDFTPSGGTWSGNGIVATSGVFDPMVAGLGLHIITYTYGDNTCQVSGIRRILIGTAPIVSAGDDELICEGTDPYILIGAVPQGGYWTGLGITDSITFDPFGISPGTYTMTYTYINDITGCENADTRDITIEANPIVTVTDTTVYCNSFNNLTLSGYNPFGGQWSGPGIVDANNGIYNTEVAGGEGIYEVFYDYTTLNGCTSRDTATIEIVYGDTIDAGPDTAICIVGGLLNITSGTPTGGTWSGTGIISPLGVFDPVSSGEGLHTVTYTYGDGSCEKTDDLEIFVGNAPNVIAGPDEEVCQQIPPYQLTGNNPPGGFWLGTGVDSSGVFYPSISGLGAHDLTYYYSNPLTSCESSAIKTVTVVPIPIVYAGDTLIICETADNINLDGQPVGGVWSGPGVLDPINGVFNTGSAGGLGEYELIYTYVQNNGCDGADTLLVDVIQADIVEAGPIDTICVDNGLLTLLGASPSGGTWSGLGIVDPFLGVFDPLATGDGIHIVTYTYGDNTCERSDNKTILVANLPPIDAGTDLTICRDELSFNLNGFSPQGGSWSGIGITDPSLGAVDPQLLGIGIHTITYSYTNPTTGCTSIDDRNITIVPLPGVYTPDSNTYCNNTDDIVLEGYGPLGGSWSGTGIIDANNGLYNTTLAGGIGQYDLVYEFVDVNGCAASDTMVVNVIEGEIVSAGPDTASCISNGLINLEGASPLGGIWSGAGISDPAFGVFDPISVGAGSHTVFYTYGEGSCEKTDTKIVLIGSIPTVDAGTPEFICLDEPSILLSGFNPAGGYWMGTSVDSSGLFNPNTAGIGTHTLTYTFVNDLTGCENSDTKTITVAGLPNVYAGDTVTYCNSNNIITLDGFAPSGGTWSGLGIVTPSGQFNTLQAGGEGQYDLVYSFTDANGCINDDTLIVDVIYGDTVEAGPNFALCITDGIQVLNDNSPTGGTWSGPGVIDPVDGFFDPSIAGAGTHIISYTFGEGTCQKTDTKIVTVGQIPPVFPGTDDIVCEDDIAFMLTGFAPINGTWTGIGITDPIGVFDPQLAGIGVHVITYTYIQPQTGCENSADKIITVEASPSVNAGIDVVYCNVMTDITITGYSPAGGTWSGPGVVNPIFGIFNTNNAGGEGIYELVYTYTNINGCANRDTVQVEVIAPPIVEAGILDTLCIDAGYLTLSGYAPLGGMWSGPGIVDPFLGIFDPLTATAGLQTLTYTYGEGTCQVSDTKDIFVSALPNVNPGPVVSICEDALAFNLTGFSPQGGYWTGFGITDSLLATFDPQITGTGVYLVTYHYTNEITSCTNEVNRTITVNALPGVYTQDSIIFCNNSDDIILTGYGPFGGTWSGAGIVDASNGVFNTVLAGGEGEYELVYGFTDQNGCFADDTMYIKVIYGDTVIAGPDFAMCIDEGIITLTEFSPFGGTWTGVGVIDPLYGIFDPNIAGAGSHTLYYIYGEDSCEKIDSREVIVGGIPPVNAGIDVILCQEDPSFTINDNSPSGGYWTGNGVDSTGLFDPALVGIGDHLLVYTFINSITGCENSDTKVITINPLPLVEAGDTVTYCNSNTTITLDGYFPIGGTWTGPGVVLSSGQFNSLQAGGIGMYELTYSYTNNNGCTDTDTKIIDIIYGDTVDAGPNFALCITDGLQILNGHSPQGGLWSGIGIVDAVSGTFDPTVAGNGIHTLTYTYGDDTCEKTDTRQVTVGLVPPVFPGTDDVICEIATAFNLTNFSPIGGVWTGWGIVDPNGIFDPQVSGVGTHLIMYEYTDPVTGCQNSATKNVIVEATPSVYAGGQVVYCDNPFDIVLENYTPTGGVWNGPGIVNPIFGIFNTEDAGGIGTYNLVYSYTNTNGCFNTDTLMIDVIYGDTVIAGPHIDMCILDGPINIVGSPSGGTWSGLGVVNTIGIFDPGLAGPGTHTLTYTYGDGTCQKSDIRTIAVGDIPVVDAGEDLELCIDAGIQTLNGYGPLGGVWAGNGVDSLGVFDPVGAGVGLHTLTYFYEDTISGCTNQDDIIVIVNALPLVNAGGAVIYCVWDDLILLDNYTPSGGSWSGAGIVDPILGTFSTAQAGGIGMYDLVYVFTDGNGCTSSDTLGVTVEAGQVLDPGPDESICIDNGILQMATFSPLGGTWTGSGIIDGLNGVFDPSISGEGLHELTYTYGAGTCERTATKFIEVYPLPFLDAGADVIVCEDEISYTFNPIPSGGIWFGQGIDSMTGVFDPQFTGLGTFDLIYLYQNPSTGCTNTDTVNITVSPLPTPSMDHPLEVCVNTLISFTNNSNGADSYFWQFGDNTNSSLDAPTHTYTNEGNYDITLIAYTMDGCSDTIVSSINILAEPVSDFDMVPNSGCAPLDVTFTNNSTGLNLSYQWDFGNGQTSLAQNPGIITFYQSDVDTFYIVSLITTNQCGTDMSSDTIFVSPIPVIDFGSDISTGCTPLPVNFTNNTVGQADQYYWDFGNGVTSTDSIPNTQIFTADTIVTYYTVTLIATNNCGADTATTIIEVLPASINSFFNVDVTEGCQPLEVNFTNLATQGASVNWDFGDGNFSILENPIHVFDTSGVFTVTQYAVNSCGIDSSTVEITVFPPSEVDFEMSDYSCVNNEVVFTNLSLDIVGSEWDFGDGNVSLLTNPTHTYTTPGTYTVTLTGYSTSANCPDVVTMDILVRENPAVALDLDLTNGCQPLNINFENDSPIIGFTQWDFGDGNFSVENDPSHIYDQPGTYTATLTNTDNWGCSTDTSVLNIIVFPQPTPSYTTSVEQLCSPSSAAQFINESTDATAYNWNFGDGTVSPYTSPQHVFPAAGIYDVTLTATNNYGCTDSITQPFEVLDSPIADLSIEGYEGCEDLFVQFYNESANADTYDWDFGDGFTGSGNAPTHTYTDPGFYDVTLHVSYNDVCFDSITLYDAIEVYQSPIADFEMVQNGDGWVAFNNNSINATNYFWDLGDGNTTTGENPVHRYDENGPRVAMLIASNPNGCMDTLVLDFQPEYFYGLQVPNAFSPETGVDIVRQFFPAGFGLREYHIQIFTPWGELMWESKAVDELGQPTEFWDGYHDGVIAPQGAYVWKVLKAEFIDGTEWQGMDYGDGKKRRVGSVTLLR